MLALPDALLAKIRKGTAHVRWDVYVDDDLVATTAAGSDVATLGVSGASTSAQIPGPTRYFANLQLTSASATAPASLLDAWSPLSNTTVRGVWAADDGSEEALWRTWRVDAGEWTWRPIQGATGVTPGDYVLSASVTCRDVTKALADVRLPTGYQVAAETNLVAEAASLIRTYDPGADVTVSAPAATSALRSYRRTSSVLEILADLSVAGGFAVSATPEGGWLLAPAPVLSDDPDMALYAGDNVLVSAARGIDRQGTVNGVIVVGDQEGSSTPIEATVWVEDAVSPLRFDGTAGPVGPMPVEFRDQSLDTVDACRVRALELLDRLTGVPESATIVMVVDPRLDVGDTVQLDVAALGLSGRFVVTRIDYAPGAASQSVTLSAGRFA